MRKLGVDIGKCARYELGSGRRVLIAFWLGFRVVPTSKRIFRLSSRTSRMHSLSVHVVVGPVSVRFPSWVHGSNDNAPEGQHSSRRKFQ